MFITHRFLQDERDWKEQKMVVMGGNRNARDAENRAKKGKVFLSAHSSS